MQQTTGARKAPSQPSQIKALRAEYVPAQWDGKNASGIKCVGVHILVLMDECAPQTTGGILYDDGMAEKLTEGSETGVLVAIGGVCFRIAEDGSGWLGVLPEVGDRIFVERYSGQKVRGKDGRIYRSMHYGAIHAVFEPDDESVQPVEGQNGNPAE